MWLSGALVMIGVFGDAELTSWGAKMSQFVHMLTFHRASTQMDSRTKPLFWATSTAILFWIVFLLRHSHLL